MYRRLQRSVKYTQGKDSEEQQRFLDDLPQKMKIELSIYIYEQTYQKILFFGGKSTSFIAWICPLLKPQFVPENDYIYFEGDQVEGVFFIKRGNVSFVLPKHSNTRYINLTDGHHFGIIDIVGSILQNDNFQFDDWVTHQDKIKRNFTVMATGDSDIMMLSLQDLNRMKLEFLEYYDNLIQDAYDQLQKALILKLKGMQKCQDYLDNWIMDRSKPFSYDLRCYEIEELAKKSLESLQDDHITQRGEENPKAPKDEDEKTNVPANEPPQAIAAADNVIKDDE